MTRHDAERIVDIVDSCRELADLAAMRDQGEVPSWILERAAERLREIVGEASGVLSESTRSRSPAVPWRDITQLRICSPTTTSGSTPPRCGRSSTGRFPGSSQPSVPDQTHRTP